MDDIIKKLHEFRNERNWKQFHQPKNLAMSIMIEAAELLENYQWEGQNEDVDNVKEELADIMSYCLLLCEEYKFDVKEIIAEKIEKNKVKYPIDKAYGKADKYNKL
ncbi:MAG: nucleotide pyrophosphohydrolase [Candidatus Izemoplasmataceae bacterium]